MGTQVFVRALSLVSALAVAITGAAGHLTCQWRQTSAQPGQIVSAFDTLRQRMVSFAPGADGTRLREWDGKEWRDRGVVTNTPFHDAALAFGDGLRGGPEVTYLYGGGDRFGRTLHGLLFSWDGARWQKVYEATTRPPARRSCAMTFDSARGELVVFGGLTSGGMIDETWSFDPFTVRWTQRSPASSPPARFSAAMSYDSARQRVVLFGGRGSTTALNDTWEWDGAAWIVQTPQTSPPALSNPAMTYDVARNVTVLCGQDAANNLETWEWTGTNWSSAAAPGFKPSRSYSLVYDQNRSEVILNAAALDASIHDETWVHNGTSWRLEHTHVSPVLPMVYDSARDQCVSFGTVYDGRSHAPRTFVLKGSSWEQPSILSQPALRDGHAMAFDSVRQQTLLFGGITSGGALLDDTWEWNGRGWSRLGSNPPTGRFGHAMAYDSARRRVVLFGGSDSSGPLDETWDFDGSTWSKLSPLTRPRGRTSHALAYDKKRDRVVMFGGVSAGVRMGDTWEWDGFDWKQIAIGGGPLPRHSHAMTYDSSDQKVLLLGGRSMSTHYSDAWSWDGVRWTRLPEGGAVGGAVSMAHDTARDRVIVQGQGGGWVRGHLASADHYGVQFHVPELHASGVPSIDNSGFSLDLVSDRFTAAAVVISAAPAYPSGGLPIFVDLSLATVLLHSATNTTFASFALPIPDDPRLIGINLYAQAVMLKNNALDLAEHGVRLTIGH